MNFVGYFALYLQKETKAFKEDITCSFSGFIILFWVATRICLHALMLKNISVFPFGLT